MKPAADRLAVHLADTQFVTPTIPVVHNVTGKPESSPDVIRSLMVEQIYSPVGWVACVQALADKGISQVVECGPGKVLAGLVKRINKEILVESTDSCAALSQTIQNHS
jgi:[acyl-carrier-protein] S-malonyltransferase